ncbi:MAG: proteasome subunit beta [Acidimicrobiia bacterium]|nr:proteasome subunit beta [Acidimicrobiia bacterium]
MTGSLLPLGEPMPGASFTELIRSLDLAPEWTLGTDAVPPSFHPPDATTVLALRYDGGVVMVGDRQATAGYDIAHRYIQKVFAADSYSAVAISGTAGLGVELIRLFQTELEHYEKLEGVRLSLDGKATYLARMVRSQLPMALQGFVVVPLFCGIEPENGTGHVFTFDAVGGRYEERDFGAAGSGSREARAYLRTVYSPEFDRTAAIDHSVAALVAAAGQDLATGGPDLRRGIYPIVVTVTTEGRPEGDHASDVAAAERALEVVR